MTDRILTTLRPWPQRRPRLRIDRPLDPVRLLMRYADMARRPRYPARAWRSFCSQFRRAAEACADESTATVLVRVAADCFIRADRAEWRDRRRNRWTWGRAPLPVAILLRADFGDLTDDFDDLAADAPATPSTSPN